MKDLVSAKKILEMKIHRERALRRLWLSESGVGKVQHGECKTSKYTFGEPF